MKVMVMVRANDKTEAGEMPSTELLEAMGAFNQALLEAGVLKAGEGLHPSGRGKRVRFGGRTTTVTDGPFAETRELIAGFWLWEVDSMADAVAWAKKIPAPAEGDVAEYEIRPIFEREDFGEEFTAELRAQEDAQRAALEE